MSTLDLINTGILMGILHVLTGPDHLSALATLCGTNIHPGERAKPAAFLLGVRWGVGHSAGLLVVGGLLIAMEESSGEWIGMDPVVRNVMEGFVGVFMLSIGAWGIVRANRKDRENVLCSQVVDASTSQVKGLALICDVHDEGGDVEMSEGVTASDGCDVVSRMSEILEDDSRHSASISSRPPCERNAEADDVSSYSGVGLDDFSFRDLSSSDDRLKEYLDQAGDVDGSPRDGSLVTIPSTRLQQGEGSSGNSSLAKAGSNLATDSSLAIPPPRMRPLPPATSGKATPARTYPPVKLMMATSLIQEHQASRRNLLDDSSEQRCCGLCGCGEGGGSITPGALALSIGVLHGIAGPGGVLGVIPAVQLRNATLAFTYLGTFCITSTFVMGGFAAFYGTLSGWLAGARVGGTSTNRVFMVELGSALLSICVGTVWLALLAVGKLDDVFP